MELWRHWGLHVGELGTASVDGSSVPFEASIFGLFAGLLCIPRLLRALRAYH